MIHRHYTSAIGVMRDIFVYLPAQRVCENKFAANVNDPTCSYVHWSTS